MSTARHQGSSGKVTRKQAPRPKSRAGAKTGMFLDTGTTPAKSPVKTSGYHYSSKAGAMAAGRALAADRAIPGAQSIMTVFEKIRAQAERKGRPTRVTFEVGPDGFVKVVTGQTPKVSLETLAEISLDDALAAARDRGQLAVARILEEPEMLSADAFGEAVGVTRTTVNAWREKNEALGLQGAKRGYRFPAWQIDANGRPSKVLPRLFDLLGGDPWTVYRFLVQRHGALDGLTGREALEQDRTDAVLGAAEGQARGTFS